MRKKWSILGDVNKTYELLELLDVERVSYVFLINECYKILLFLQPRLFIKLIEDFTGARILAHKMEIKNKIIIKNNKYKRFPFI